MDVLSYPNSPELMPRKRAPVTEKFKDDRPRDAMGHVYRETQKGVSHTRFTLRYRDGGTETVFYPSVREAMRLGSHVNWKRAILDNQDLSGLRAAHLDFSEASLQDVQADNCTLDSCKFDKAKMSGSFNCAKLQNCSFVETHIEGDFSDADVSFSDFTRAKGFANTEHEGCNTQGVKGLDLRDIEPEKESIEEEPEEEVEDDDNYTPEEQAELDERERWNGLTPEQKIAEMKQDVEEEENLDDGGMDDDSLTYSDMD